MKPRGCRLSAVVSRDKPRPFVIARGNSSWQQRANGRAPAAARSTLELQQLRRVDRERGRDLREPVDRGRLPLRQHVVELAS